MSLVIRSFSLLRSNCSKTLLKYIWLLGALVLLDCKQTLPVWVARVNVVSRVNSTHKLYTWYVLRLLYAETKHWPFGLLFI